MSPAAPRKPYPSDVSDEEWWLIVPYLTLMKEDAPQREHSMRELFNGLRYVITERRIVSTIPVGFVGITGYRRNRCLKQVSIGIACRFHSSCPDPKWPSIRNSTP